MQGNEPVFACAYGPSKAGKTTDALYSFPQGLFLGDPAALKPHRWIGYDRPPRSTNPLSLKELIGLLEKSEVKSPKIVDGKAYFPALIVDDFSLLVDRTIVELEKRLNGFQLWGEVREEIITFRDLARRKGLHIWLNAHESPPREKNGLAVRIGPKMPGSLPEDFPAACDLVVRCAQSTRARYGWPYVFRVGPAMREAITGDRDGIAFDGVAMNSAELLRANGFHVPRLAGLEWLDSAASKLAEYLLPVLATAENLDPIVAVAMKARIGIEAKYRNGMEANRWLAICDWAIRDGYDRAEIIHGRSIGRGSAFQVAVF
jgi:hypothetical protein